MEKKNTPAITIVFYIAGILFLVVSAFMLITAIGYTRTYLQSYEASFADMWSNSLQYIIGQFVPYLGLGVVSLGIGKAIKEMRNVKVDAVPAAAPQPEANQVNANMLAEMQQRQTAAAEKLAEKIKYLSEDIDTTREILGIKISEKEKRDAYRLQEMGKGLTAAFETLDRKTPEPIIIEVPAAPAVPETAVVTPEPEVPAEPAPAVPAAPAEPAGPVPQIFRVARNMTAPACDAIKTKPQIFTVSRRMTMPKCEAPKTRPQIFTVSRRMVMPACAAPKARPQIFTVSRRMVMPACK